MRAVVTGDSSNSQLKKVMYANLGRICSVVSLVVNTDLTFGTIDS